MDNAQFTAAYSQCADNLNELADYYATKISDRNESTTRLHLIDTLVFECLGWEKHNVITEEHQRRQVSEYADYTFLAPRRMMVLEAKREGEYFDIPLSKTSFKYTIRSICQGNPALKAAVEQVSGYCQSRGVPIATICNGHQLLAFIAVRTDGTPPLDGHALVFPSLRFMHNHFVDLWNGVSRLAVEENRLSVRLLGRQRAELPSTIASSISQYPGTKGRNDLQAELQHLSEIVIEDLPESPPLEIEFLTKCYCQSGALSQHSLASKSILKARYDALFDESSPGRPTAAPLSMKGKLSPDAFAVSISRRPVLLLGDVGVGKSTFIRHLIAVDAPEVFKNAIAIRIDLGAQGVLAVNLRDFMITEIERQLEVHHGFHGQQDNIVRGIYRKELDDFKKSIFGSLSQTDPVAFAAKEIQMLSDLLSNRAEHCKRSLDHLSKARRKQVVIFIDNADQRNDATQDEAFLVAQEIAAGWPALVYVPLRPETFHRSVGKGALSGYHPKAFTIAPPRVDRVLQLRLQYAVTIANEMIQQHLQPEKVEALVNVIEAFRESLEVNDALVECIENIAGGNIRLALSLVKSFLGSGHVDTRKIAQKVTARDYTVPVHEFLRAAIYGDNVYYSTERSPFANMFDIASRDGREHFLLAILLDHLRSESSKGTGYVELECVYSEIQGLGFLPEQIDYAIVRAHRKRLIETPASSSPEGDERRARSVRVTTVGLYHVSRLIGMFTYVDAVCVATPVLDAHFRNHLRDVHSISDRLARAETFINYLSQQWDSSDFPPMGVHWPTLRDGLLAEIAKIQSLGF